MTFRKLNRRGISAFSDYIRKGASGLPPLDLLKNMGTTEPLQQKVEAGTGEFSNRYDFGIYLNTLLRKFDRVSISEDSGFWSALALLWFNKLCPVLSDGNRRLRKEYCYILSSDYRHYYRHLVRSPWQLVGDYGAAARFLLISPSRQHHPLSVHGDILEQLGGRQRVLASESIIRAASRLYFDEENQRPRAGAAGNGGGSARRFGLVLRQLDLTYDPESMSEDDFIDILPDEFDRWQRRKTKKTPQTG